MKEEDDVLYNNSLVSWQCITSKQKWFGRCLEPNYVSLKCHLLERFLHDVLFESLHPLYIYEFLGLHLIDIDELNTW